MHKRVNVQCIYPLCCSFSKSLYIAKFSKTQALPKDWSLAISITCWVWAVVEKGPQIFYLPDKEIELKYLSFQDVLLRDVFKISFSARKLQTKIHLFYNKKNIPTAGWGASGRLLPRQPPLIPRFPRHSETKRPISSFSEPGKVSSCRRFRSAATRARAGARMHG